MSVSHLSNDYDVDKLLIFNDKRLILLLFAAPQKMALQIFIIKFKWLQNIGSDWRCCINQKDSLIINYLQFEPILVKLLLINNLAVFMQQRRSDSKLESILIPIYP